MSGHDQSCAFQIDANAILIDDMYYTEIEGTGETRDHYLDNHSTSNYVTGNELNAGQFDFEYQGDYAMVTNQSTGERCVQHRTQNYWACIQVSDPDDFCIGVGPIGHKVCKSSTGTPSQSQCYDPQVQSNFSSDVDVYNCGSYQSQGLHPGYIDARDNPIPLTGSTHGRTDICIRLLDCSKRVATGVQETDSAILTENALGYVSCYQELGEMNLTEFNAFVNSTIRPLGAYFHSESISGGSVGNRAWMERTNNDGFLIDISDSEPHHRIEISRTFVAQNVPAGVSPSSHLVHLLVMDIQFCGYWNEDGTLDDSCAGDISDVLASLFGSADDLTDPGTQIEDAISQGFDALIEDAESIAADTELVGEGLDMWSSFNPFFPDYACPAHNINYQGQSWNAFQTFCQVWIADDGPRDIFGWVVFIFTALKLADIFNQAQRDVR